MQITPASLTPAAILPPATAGSERSDQTVRQLQQGTLATPQAPSTAPSVDADTADSVSISAEAQEGTANTMPSPVYAEIWKGMIKIAQIDIHGHVSSFSALVPSNGGGVSGPLLAAQRAVQVAQQVGGEIRAGGLPLDSQTLLMRARLAKAYVN